MRINKGHNHSNKRSSHLILIALGIALITCVLLSLAWGRYPISPTDSIQMVVAKLWSIPHTWTERQETLFFNVRLPRVLLALLVGAALSSAGAAFQGIFQNPLVSSDILGASQGAALGAAVAILAGVGSFLISLSAFGMSLLSIVLVLIISSRAQGGRILVLVLTGVMVSSLFSAGVSYTKLIADPTNQLADITYWLMGSLTGAKMSDLSLSIIPFTCGLIVLFVLRWRINILTMGDDEAQTMGVNAPRIRFFVIVAATLLTATSVAVTGIIGWVGLVIPHLARMLIGSDYRVLMPASMLLGGTFLLLVDDIARLATTAEIPIGILTAFVGAPFFLYLITRQAKRSAHE